MILFLGIITSYEDVKFWKIRNKWIVLGISYVILIYFLLYFFYTVYNLNLMHLNYLLINGILALIIGFLIWFFGLWTAGDAKLFFSYSVLIPLDAYKSILFTYFPAANLLLLTFIPLALIYLFTSIILIFKNKQFALMLKSIRIAEIKTSLLFLFSISWILKLILNYVGISLNVSNAILMILLFLIIGRISKLRVNAILLIIALLRLFLDSTVFLVRTWINLIVLFLVFFVIRFLVLNRSFSLFIRTVKISNLKEGMIPAELILKIGDKYKKVPSAHIASNRFLPKNAMPLFTPKSKGLSPLDIIKINRIRKKLPFDQLKVKQTISFAPVLFFGAIVNVFIGLYL